MISWPDALRQPHGHENEHSNALINEWNNIPQQVIANLVLSMRRRCTACTAANSSYTRYLLLLLNVSVLIFDRVLLLHYSIFWKEI